MLQSNGFRQRPIGQKIRSGSGMKMSGQLPAGEGRVMMGCTFLPRTGNVSGKFYVGDLRQPLFWWRQRQSSFHDRQPVALCDLCKHPGCTGTVKNTFPKIILKISDIFPRVSVNSSFLQILQGVNQ